MSRPKTSSRLPKAFTLIEILIVISILALLLIALLLSFRKDREKAEDVRVKTDLERLKIAFEEYYTDNNCYPPGEWFDSPDDCGSNLLKPYLSAIPCNKKTNQPYILEYTESQCSGFRLYTTLNNPFDSAALSLCASSGGSTLGNYGVSSSNTTVQISCATTPSPSPLASVTPSPSPSPSISPTPLPSGQNYYWCSSVGNCTSFDPQVYFCTPYYVNDVNCGGNGNKCESVGSCVIN